MLPAPRFHLHQQALPQGPRGYSNRIEGLHQLDRLAENRRGLFSSCSSREGGGCAPLAGAGVCPERSCEEALQQFLVGREQIPIFVEIADDILGGIPQLPRNAERAKLPRKVVAERTGLRKKILERRFVAQLETVGGAKAGIEVVLKIRAKIDFVEGILLLPRGFDLDSATLRSRSASRPAISSSRGTFSSTSSRTGFSTISALIISLSSSLFSARTLTICIRPGVRI